MPLDVRANAIRVAVLAFFLLCVIGICCGLAPSTICSRAIIGALAVYAATAVTVKIINVVLLDVLISKFLDNQKRQKNEPEY